MWWKPIGQGRTDHAHEANIYDADETFTRIDGPPNAERHSAQALFRHAAPGSIIDILTRRIAELEDENAILRGILSSVPPPDGDG